MGWQSQWGILWIRLTFAGWPLGVSVSGWSWLCSLVWATPCPSWGAWVEQGSRDLSLSFLCSRLLMWLAASSLTSPQSKTATWNWSSPSLHPELFCVRVFYDSNRQETRAVTDIEREIQNSIFYSEGKDLFFPCWCIALPREVWGIFQASSRGQLCLDSGKSP